MNAPTYLAQLANVLACTYVPKCTTFKNDTTSNRNGAVIGTRKGYLVALALIQAGRSNSFAILVRLSPGTAAGQIQEAIKSKPGFSSFLSKKSVKVVDQGLMVSWTFAMTK